MSEDRHKETLMKPTATETLETQVMSKHSEASDQDFDSLLKEALTIAEEYAGSDKSAEPEKTVEDSTPEEIQGHVGNEKTKDTKEYVEEKVFTGTNKNVSVEAEAGEEVYKLRRNIHVVKDDTSKDKVHSNDYESLQVPGMTKGKMNRRVTHEKLIVKIIRKVKWMAWDIQKEEHPIRCWQEFHLTHQYFLYLLSYILRSCSISTDLGQMTDTSLI